MLTLYLGSDPEIALTENENVANKLAGEKLVFDGIKAVHKYCDKNDNSMAGYLYYSCWKFHNKVFQS